MKKLTLLISMIFVSFVSGQNYFETQFIGESKVLTKGSGAQRVPLIEQLNGTEFLAAGGNAVAADYDYTAGVSPEVAPTLALTYTYLTKFDLKPTVLGTIDSTINNSDFTIYPNPAEFDINIKSAKKIDGATI